MRRNHENLYLRTCLPVEDVVGEAMYAVAPDTWRKLYAVTIWRFADLDHRRLEGRQVAGT